MDDGVLCIFLLLGIQMMACVSDLSSLENIENFVEDYPTLIVLDVRSSQPLESSYGTFVRGCFLPIKSGRHGPFH